MGNWGIWELVIILVAIVILFGATRIPKLLRGLGEGVREFKDAVKEPNEDDTAAKDDAPDDTTAGNDAPEDAPDDADDATGDQV